MKNFMRSVLVIVLFLISTNLTQSQNIIEVNQTAAETTAELKKQVKFDSEQEDLIYKSYVLYHKKLKQIESIGTANSKSALEEKKKVYSELCENLKSVLSKEQFARFEEYEKYKSE